MNGELCYNFLKRFFEQNISILMEKLRHIDPLPEYCELSSVLDVTHNVFILFTWIFLLAIHWLRVARKRTWCPEKPKPRTLHLVYPSQRFHLGILHHMLLRSPRPTVVEKVQSIRSQNRIVGISGKCAWGFQK